jgi:hypothetical protein
MILFSLLAITLLLLDTLIIAIIDDYAIAAIDDIDYCHYAIIDSHYILRHY